MILRVFIRSRGDSYAEKIRDVKTGRRAARWAGWTTKKARGET